MLVAPVTDRLEVNGEVWSGYREGSDAVLWLPDGMSSDLEDQVTEALRAQDLGRSIGGGAEGHVYKRGDLSVKEFTLSSNCYAEPEELAASIAVNQVIGEGLCVPGTNFYINRACNRGALITSVSESRWALDFIPGESLSKVLVRDESLAVPDSDVFERVVQGEVIRAGIDLASVFIDCGEANLIVPINLAEMIAESVKRIDVALVDLGAN